MKNALAPGQWSVVYTNSKGEKVDPLIWRHWIRSNPNATEDSIWYMNQTVSAKLMSPTVWPLPYSVASPAKVGVPDAVPGPAQPREYQVLFDKASGFCSSGICTASLDISNALIKDVASDELLHGLFPGGAQPFGDYVAGHSSLVGNPALLRTLADLVTMTWEGSPTIQSLRCIAQAGADCNVYLLEGSHLFNSKESVTRWLYASDLHSDSSWFVQKNSLLDLALPNPPTKIVVAALLGNVDLNVVGRSSTNTVVMYVDPDDQEEILALWDVATMAEIRRVPIIGWSGSAGEITDTLPLAGPGTFGQALINYLKGLASTSSVSVRVRHTPQSLGYLFREEVGPGKTKLSYFSVAQADRADIDSFADTKYCIRTGDTDSIAAALWQRRQRSEAPNESPSEGQLAVDYVEARVGVDQRIWRRDGFLANPTSILKPRNDLPVDACTIP
jgi:hypothetical protein